MTDERAEELSKIFESVIFSTGLPWHKDFETREQREEYIKNTYNGATLPELLSIGIDPFR